MQYYIYVITNKRHGTLYIGATNNLAKRVWEHKNKVVFGFSQKYSLDQLVYYEVLEGFYESRNREAQLKKWKRAWKIRLIEEMNPDWKDLSKEL